jgi:D-serine deaminase-like pyridoxal phosphate-dependent protein
MKDNSYFQTINQSLRAHERAIPFFLIDLDRLDQNLQTLRFALQGRQGFRIVVKSLPCSALLSYISDRLQTQRYMVFHEPILNRLVKELGPQADILMGKPMPVKTARHFYHQLPENLPLEPFRQIQWLVDTEDRLQQYIQLSHRLKKRLRINLEIDVGLHRGGFNSLEALDHTLSILKNVPDWIEFSGLMGYDPHVVKIPGWLQSTRKSMDRSTEFYRSCIELIRERHPEIWHENLTFNGAGSPTLHLHLEDSPLNELAAGSCLLKPADFDLPTLDAYVPAAYIATPILKKCKTTQLPGLEKGSKLLSLGKSQLQNAYFIYGGYWMADYCYPTDAGENQLFGSSTNQSMINSRDGDLQVDDFIFLRPRQSESVMRQFEDILLLRDQKIQGVWHPF